MTDEAIFLLLYICMILGITIFALFGGMIVYLSGTVLYNLGCIIAGLIRKVGKHHGKKSVYTS